jgi:hypothetical protein
VLGASPARPAGMLLRPTQIVPFMKVPVVSTTAGARNFIPKKVVTCKTGHPVLEYKQHIYVKNRTYM